MKRRVGLVWFSLLALGLAAIPPAGAATPEIANGRVETRAVGAGLEAAIKAATASANEATWIGWSAPLVPGRHSCCADGQRCGARLEGDRADRPGVASGVVKLEGADRLLLFVRAEAGRLERLAFFLSDCLVDAGGRPVIWLEGAKAADSAAWLAAQAAAQDGRRSLGDGALAALSQHADPAADTALADLARRGASGHLRGQALFWLGQRAGTKAVGEIARAIAEDPETEVKKRAVFALGQLPADEGVPLLIKTARENRNPEVRRQAFFWLGQSKDPRALAFFESVLLR